MRKILAVLLIHLILTSTVCAKSIYRHLEPETINFFTAAAGTATSSQFQVNENIKAVKYLAGASKTITGFTCNISDVASYYFVTNPSIALTQYIGLKVVLSDGTKTATFYPFNAGTVETYGNNIIGNGDFSTVSITYNTLVGTFASGDIVTDSVTGAIGTFSSDTGTVLTLTNVSGTFTATDAITALPSLATAVVVSQSPQSWSTSLCTIASITGGQSGNCLKITRTSGSQQYANQYRSGKTPGTLWNFSSYIKQGTNGIYTHTVFFDGTGDKKIINASATSDWVQSSAYATISPSGNQASCFLKTDMSSSGTLLFDTISYTQVLTPSSTGVTATTTLGGTAGMTVESGFDFNKASYTLTASLN